ncbi:hypothetical protein [Nioella nitratireducens]|uniref:hypothetical protein n=1 Tax=Nioella nitratireducens TaxID=1287720 RepID=UPI0008FCF12A|nr:hypothetical protein [Nioella nitratireducens]
MKLYKSLFAAAALSALGVTGASAMTVAQCTEVGGSVDLAAATCVLTALQEESARALGYLPAAEGAGTATAGLGGVTVSGGAAAAAGGLILTAILIGDGTTGTTTTTTTTN